MSVLSIASAVETFVTFYAVQPLLILFIGVFIGKVLQQTMLFIFNEVKLQTARYELIAYICMWIVYIVTAMFALASVNVLLITLYFLGGAVATVIVIWILLGLRDFFPNFLSYHAVQTRYKPGSAIHTRTIEGKVVSVQLIDTHIRNAHGEDIYIPNSTMRRLRKQT